MIYAISDLHMGDGGPRDNFAGRERALMSFLDMVEDTNGRLVICGDLFELWQSNISKVITKRIWLLDRLAKMEAIYVLGNHDADLLYFQGYGRQWLNHPFFSRMVPHHLETVGDRRFCFIHGHEADPYCKSDTPGIGRITAIYTGLGEDKHGSPRLDKHRTVESKMLGPWNKLASVWGRLRGEPDRDTGINRNLRSIGVEQQATIVCGHTHSAGRAGDVYNCGTWAEQTHSFIRIQPGLVEVFDWADNTAALNKTQLPI